MIGFGTVGAGDCAGRWLVAAAEGADDEGGAGTLGGGVVVLSHWMTTVGVALPPDTIVSLFTSTS